MSLVGCFIYESSIFILILNRLQYRFRYSPQTRITNLPEQHPLLTAPVTGYSEPVNTSAVSRASFHVPPHDGSAAPLKMSASTTPHQRNYPQRDAGLPREKLLSQPSTRHYLSVLMVNHDVVRFDISVHDSHAMAVI